MTGFAPGDVVEIAAERGFAYLQVTHLHPAYPEVVRLLPGIHRSRPKEISAFCAGADLGVALFPASAVADRASAPRLARIASEPVPPARRPFPTFKTPIPDRRGGIAYWWFWDGDGLRYVTEPPAGIEEMPLREVSTTAQILKRIGAATATP